MNRLLFLEQELRDSFEANRDEEFDGFMLDYDLLTEEESGLAPAV